MATPGQQTDEVARVVEWVHLHGRAVRGYLLGLIGRPDEADELAQEVFLRAWQARHRYREQGAARAYLLRIADRLACDRSRRAGRETTLHDEEWSALEPAGREPDPADRAMRIEKDERLAGAFERLSPVQRRVLLLRYHGELSFAEIAETVGCPLNTVLSHCHRGLEKLRKVLSEESL